MVKFKCWGILREKDHSPDRVSDDAAILYAVADKLRQNAHIDVTVFPANQINNFSSLPDIIFYMCEEEPVLNLFSQWQDSGVIFVNNVESVKNTFRENTLEILSDYSNYPRTVKVSTDNPCPNGFERVWVKRGDYHAIQKEDVVYADSSRKVTEILEKFNARGIASALIQDHVGGDLIKFYGVRDSFSNSTKWFHWFYHKNQDLKGYLFDEKLLETVCEEGADRLGLEIFGGDVIVSETGELWLIDVNAWPSFALFRDEASNFISDYIVSRLETSMQQIEPKGGVGNIGLAVY